jgi:hypothetical protein
MVILIVTLGVGVCSITHSKRHYQHLGFPA